MNGYEPPVVFVHRSRRTLGGLTWVYYDDVRGDAAQPGTRVMAIDPATMKNAYAVVVRLNPRWKRIYLAVPWMEMEKKE